MKKIYFLKPSSFCFGVKNSINQLEKIIQKNQKQIYCIHELVHNPNVNNYFKQKGIKFVDSIDQIKNNQAIVVFSAHGVNRVILKKAQKKFYKVFNLECPFVSKIYNEADQYISNGIKTFFYIGKNKHQEGQNIINYLKSQNSEVYNFLEEKDIPQIDKQTTFGILTQTTLNYKNITKLIQNIKFQYPNAQLPKLSDICKATFQRQEVILQNINKFDSLIIIGGKNSNNTKELVKLGETKEKKVFFGQSLEEILKYYGKTIFNYKKIGLTGGASTPLEDISKTFDYFKNIGYQTKLININIQKN